MNHWHQRFLDLATFISKWSKDPSTKVGCVITEGNRIISLGFNGPPKGIKDSFDRLENRETKLKLTLHAELNAILFAKRDLSTCTLYCTHPPCAQCAAVIIQSGIKEVHYFAQSKDFYDRWKEDIKLTHELFLESSVMWYYK